MFPVQRTETIEVAPEVRPAVEALLEVFAKAVQLPGARGETERAGLILRAEHFREHAARRRCPEYKAQGLPIGSGAREGACKDLVKGRLARVGQRRDPRAGIQRIRALRVRIFDNRWEDFWKETVEPIAA